MKIRISIVDDHPIVMNGINKMLEHSEDFTIVATYPEGQALLEGLEHTPTDVILLDIQMPGKTGADLAPIILKKYPNIKILALTNYDSTLHVQNMLRHGVLGYLLKTTDKITLEEAIMTVYEGNEFLEKSMKQKIEESGQRLKREVSTKSALTVREMEILKCIVDGDSSQEMADKLFLSLRTIDNYRSNILLKLDAKNIAILVKKALEMGLV